MVMENAVATELIYTGVVDGVFTRTILGDKFRPTKSTMRFSGNFSAVNFSLVDAGKRTWRGSSTCRRRSETSAELKPDLHSNFVMNSQSFSVCVASAVMVEYAAAATRPLHPEQQTRH